MKKFFTYLLAFAAVTSVISCNDSDETAQPVAAPVITWSSNPNFDKMDITDEMDVKIHIEAPAGIESFKVAVESEALKGLGITEIDLINPAENIAAFIPIILGEAGNPKDKTSYTLDLSKLVPMIIPLTVDTEESDHTFTATVGDKIGQTVTKIAVFHKVAEEYPVLDISLKNIAMLEKKSDTNLYIKFSEDDFAVGLELYFPAAPDRILPEGTYSCGSDQSTYTIFTNSYVEYWGADYDYDSYYLKSGSLSVTADEAGNYKITGTVVGEGITGGKLQFNITFEGKLAVEPEYPVLDISLKNIAMLEKKSDTNLYIKFSEDDFAAGLELYFPAAPDRILPEGTYSCGSDQSTYTIFTNSYVEYWGADYDYDSYYLKSGSLSVTADEAGNYKITGTVVGEGITGGKLQFNIAFDGKLVAP